MGDLGAIREVIRLVAPRGSDRFFGGTRRLAILKTAARPLMGDIVGLIVALPLAIVHIFVALRHIRDHSGCREPRLPPNAAGAELF